MSTRSNERSSVHHSAARPHHLRGVHHRAHDDIAVAGHVVDYVGENNRTMGQPVALFNRIEGSIFFSDLHVLVHGLVPAVRAESHA